MKSLYLIVDMQDTFAAANSPTTVAACKKLIQKAVQENSSILFLEYKWHGITKPELTTLTRKHPYVNYLKKTGDDGSKEVKNFFKRTRTTPETLFVAGVNTNFCVRDTVLGLTDVPGMKISLVLDACNSNWPGVEAAVSQMKYAGVTIV